MQREEEFEKKDLVHKLQLVGNKWKHPKKKSKKS